MVGRRVSVELEGSVRDGITRHAQDRYPEECCGILLGTVAETAHGEGTRKVVDFRPLDNEEETGRERRYLIGPQAFLEAENEARRRNLEILGIYHSHPDHPAVPSETDREQAWPWYSYLIVSVREGAPRELRSWRLLPDRSRFEEERLEDRRPNKTNGGP